MKSVSSVAALSRWGWRRVVRIATARKTGAVCDLTAGALPATEMQIAQRFELPDTLA